MKKNKKRKIFEFIVVILLFTGSVLYFLNVRVKNIYVVGNKILTDQEIIELSTLENYPKLFQKTSKNIENKIKISPYIEDVKVKKNLFGKVVIEVLEYKILLKDETDNQYYLSNYTKMSLDDDILGVPILINYVELDILNQFMKKLNNIDKDILEKISEIEYTPNEYDQDLFLFYMNDGNYVYITTTRLLNINKYIEIVDSLDGKKGILYLDSGNHFKILD